MLIEKFRQNKDGQDWLRIRYYFATANSEKEIILCSFFSNGEIRVFEHCLYMGESEEFWFFISESECFDFYVIAKDRRRNLYTEGIKGSPSFEYSSEFRGRIIDQIRKFCPFFEEVIYRKYESVFMRRAESGMQLANKAVFETVKATSYGEDEVKKINSEIVTFYKKYLSDKKKNQPL